MMPGTCRILIAVLLAGMPLGLARAQGHGPAYGLSTPTLARGGWSLDVAAMGRWGEGDTRSAMLRPMLSYGITEDLQLSLSVPVPLVEGDGLRAARVATRMPAARDAEALLGWRFHRRATGVGSRFESTAYIGIDVPTDEVRGGIRTSPALYGALVTGYASRSVYAWAGAAYRRPRRTEPGDGGRRGDVVMYSLVVGYRPEWFRRELPHPDWRIFIEAVGERAGADVVSGAERPGTSRHEIFVGPTLLGLFGAWGISGGPVFPIYRDPDGVPGDRVRAVINTTFWF